jgi:hypothetical protein
MNIRKLKHNPIVAFAMGFDKLTGKILRYGVTQTGKTLVRGFKRVTKSGKRIAVKSHYRNGAHKATVTRKSTQRKIARRNTRI